MLACVGGVLFGAEPLAPDLLQLPPGHHGGTARTQTGNKTTRGTSAHCSHASRPLPPGRTKHGRARRTQHRRRAGAIACPLPRAPPAPPCSRAPATRARSCAPGRPSNAAAWGRRQRVLGPCHVTPPCAPFLGASGGARALPERSNWSLQKQVSNAWCVCWRAVDTMKIDSARHKHSAHAGSRWAVQQATSVAAMPLGIRRPLRSALAGPHVGIHVPVGVGGCGCVAEQVYADSNISIVITLPHSSRWQMRMAGPAAAREGATLSSLNASSNGANRHPRVLISREGRPFGEICLLPPHVSNHLRHLVRSCFIYFFRHYVPRRIP